jgi:hypothetical protein
MSAAFAAGDRRSADGEDHADTGDAPAMASAIIARRRT